MDNQSTNTAAQLEQTTTPAGAAQTQSTAGNVDIDAIVSRAADKAAEVAQSRMEGTFKSMLKQSGLDADTIAKITEEWQAKQVTPEQTIAQLQGDVAARDAKIEAMEQATAIKEAGIPPKEVDYYMRRAKEHAAEKNLSFAESLNAVLVEEPCNKKASARSGTDSGTGRTSMTATELDNLKADYDKARKQGNSPKMVELRMLAKQKGLTFD